MRRRWVILIMVIAVLLAGGAVGGLYFRGPIERLIGLGDTSTAEPAPKTVRPEDVVFCDVPDIMVMLDSRGRPGRHVLKLGVSLELDDKAEQERVQAHMPHVIDVFQVYVRQLKIEDVASVAQMQQLRGELLKRLNAALQPSHIDNILFRQVQVQ